MKCSFCGEEMQRGTGKMFVKKDATVHYFCSNKCEKNMLKLRRSDRKVKWTKKYREAKGVSKKVAA